MIPAVRNEIKELRTYYHQWRIRRHPYRYVITYEVGGNPIRYMTWDYNQVWRWTRSSSMAARFTSEQVAQSCVQSTSLPDRFRYSIRRIPR